MVNTTQKNIYKATLLLLLGLCLGGAGKLYATQNDEVDEKKEDMPDTAQDTSPNDADNEAGGGGAIEWNDKHQVDWSCGSIQSCKALVTIMGCLEYWQKVTNDIEQLGQVFQYLSASNNYRDILSAYHHVLDEHLNGYGNKEAFQFINGRLQQQITCNFAKCKGYDRNQRDRGNEKAEKDEVDEYGEELIFIRDTLDTIHAYLVHGSDSGHRYSPSKHKPYKVHKRPMDDSSDDEKEPDTATTSYTLFDEEMAKLREWQSSIKKKGRNQTKNKFSTTEVLKKQKDDKISFELLAAHFTNNFTFALWLKYLRDNACDTDVLLYTVHDDIEENILYSGFKGDKKIVTAVANFIHQKEQAKQDAETNKKTASYGFGVRLWYWEEAKDYEEEDKHQPPYRICDLYVAPFYPSFKNEMLAKKDISISTWNKKMYAAKLMLAQSATLKRLEVEYDYEGIGMQEGTGISIGHLLSIIFYTNFTALCTAFGESLRYLSPRESLQALVQRNSKWYYLSRYLVEVVICFGTKIGWDDIYYHGVSYLLFTQFSVHWYGPLSTSKQMEVATLFTNSTNNGLLLELKKDDPDLTFFNVSLLSCFGSEDERLFIWGAGPIQIATIRLLKDNINLQQIMHALFIVHSMIKGKKPGDEDKAFPSDAAIYKDLGAPSTQIPRYAQDIWNTFRYQQQRITIDIQNMYGSFQVFIPLLIDIKCKNLLLLDKIVKLFPNVTEIICRQIDGDMETGVYSAAIVCSNFILGVKERLSKLDKHAKLTKIVIQTVQYEINDDYKLYAPQFGALGWQIGSGGNTIVLTKEPYNVMCKDVIPKIKSMIQGESPQDEATSLDVPIFKQLIAGSKDISADMQQVWNKLRHQQQRITIDMRDMYKYYKAFILLLFDAKLKNLLLLDKIVQLFPNVTKIICAATDCIKGSEDSWKGEYSAAIVCSNFILGVKEKLSKLDKQVKLTKIVIQTYKYEIKDDCKQYAPQFGALGWKIGKRCNGKAIVITKESYDVMYKDVIPKIKSMIQGEYLKDDIPPFLDVTIFNKLINGDKDIPADVQKQWDAFRHQQQHITIDMKEMYRNYKAFMPLLFDPKCTNLLLLDKIVQLFPNVTEIICAATDCIGEKYDKKRCWEGEYSSAILNSNFILGVKERLSKLDKKAKLTKIVIQTYEHEIGDDGNLYPTQFGALGWQVQRGSYKNDGFSAAQKNNQITLIKAPHGDIWEAIIKEGVIPWIAPLIAGKSSDDSTLTSASCMPIFKQLIVGAKDIPANVQKKWNAFRHNQQRITIDMYYMYGRYKAFMPLLFDPKVKNLLLLDKIAKIFPNVTEIICAATDCIGGKYDKYRYCDGELSSAILNSNFILGVKERLSKLDKHAKLTKIVIQTYKYEIKDDCKLYAPQFAALGWQVQRGSYKNDGFWAAQKNNQITLIKAPHGNIWESIINEGVIPHIASLIAGRLSDDSKLTSASCVPIFKQLIVGAKDIPANVQKEWEAFKKPQQYITINMKYMYQHYQAFMPLLFDPKCKNLLLLDKIAQLFPNVTEIICQNTDWDDEAEADRRGNKYSAAIVCSNFILGVKERLSKLDKHAKLTKIVIQTERKSIQDDCKLYPTPFEELGWKIGKGCDGHTIVVTKEAYDVVYKDVISKIKSMLQGEEPLAYLPPSLDMPIFNKLTVGAKDIPADVQKHWDAFIHQQQRITIDMWEMYTSYKAFMPLLCDPKIKNLLLLDKIVQLFPNVTEIICKKTDCVGIKDNGFERKCSADIVCSNFILGVKERLSKIGKHEKLTEIVILTYKHEIKDGCKLYAPQFGALGWQVQRGSWVTKNMRGDHIKHKNSLITLTRLKKPNASSPNGPPALSEANKNKPKDHQLPDNEVFDLD